MSKFFISTSLSSDHFLTFISLPFTLCFCFVKTMYHFKNTEFFQCCSPILGAIFSIACFFVCCVCYMITYILEFEKDLEHFSIILFILSTPNFHLFQLHCFCCTHSYLDLENDKYKVRNTFIRGTQDTIVHWQQEKTGSFWKFCFCNSNNIPL